MSCSAYSPLLAGNPAGDGGMGEAAWRSGIWLMSEGAPDRCWWGLLKFLTGLEEGGWP